MKNLFLSIALMSFLPLFSNQATFNREHPEEYFELTKVGETYRIDGVKLEYQNATELRIYSDISGGYRITEIAPDAFSTCAQLETLMMPTSVITVSDASFNGTSLASISYTGNNQLFSQLGLTLPCTQYSLDEGFINLWNETITEVCDTTMEQYQTLKEYYSALNEDDLSFVRSFKYNGTDSIGYVYDYLHSLYEKNNNNNTQNSRTELDQKTTLVIVMVIAVFGMTFISVFYLLKTKQIIE